MLFKNNNWVTVRDKCPQINVKFKWHTFLKKINIFERTDKRTHECTNERVDERTVQFYYAPNFIWGHKNVDLANKWVGLKNVY